MWKDLEARRQAAELDPAKEAGSDIFELEGSYPGVQRLHALGAQVRAKTGQAAAQEEPEKPQERGHGAATGVGTEGRAATAEEGLHSVSNVPSDSLPPASLHGWLAFSHMMLVTRQGPGHAIKRFCMCAAPSRHLYACCTAWEDC